MNTNLVVIRRHFSELTVPELYEILRVRSAIFVVEQQCAYQDIDGLDQKSEHFYCLDETGTHILAYLRLFPREDQLNALQIGRVLTVLRGRGLGEHLVNSALQAADGIAGIRYVYAEAQVQAEGFYERMGFECLSEPFMEDEIPHVLMRREKQV